MAGARRDRRGWDHYREGGVGFLVLGVVLGWFFIWFRGAPFSLSEWREAEEFDIFLWWMAAMRYGGLLMSLILCLWGFAVIVGPRALFGDKGVLGSIKSDEEVDES